METLIKNITSKDVPLSLALAMLAKKYYGVSSNLLAEKGTIRYHQTLYFISQNTDCTQQFLADYFDIDKASVVRIIDYLSDNGLVKREENKIDKRAYHIKLTAKGLKLIPTIKAAIETTNKATYKGISAAEQKLFLKTIEKILLNLSIMPSKQYIVEFLHEKKSKK
jgi:DNA-binding MarR family transcriptional regulator